MTGAGPIGYGGAVAHHAGARFVVITDDNLPSGFGREDGCDAGGEYTGQSLADVQKNSG